MRRDIDKVVFERAKAGRTWASKTPRVKQVLLDREGEQFNEASNSIRRKRQKERNRHFNAVKHLLLCRTGKPWNKVYAEVCASADARSVLGAAIRDFVKSFVATECWFEDRKLMTHDRHGRPIAVRGLYVHPKTNMLMRSTGSF